MKAALFSPVAYHGNASPGWPVPADVYSQESAAHSFNTALDRFRLADEIGFDWVTVAEHHFSPFSLTPNPMLLAGALTQVVKKAKIAVLGPTLPMLNPVRVAEEFAMLDTITGGRVVAGLMRGTPNEYVTYNVNPEESRSRFQEGLHLLRMAWTEPQPFGWQGRHYEFRAISVWPRPVQKPHPPIYMSGSSPESGEFAAKNHVGLGFAVTTLPLATKAAAHYRTHAEAAGWKPTADDVIYRCAIHVADSDEQAQADMANMPPQRRFSISNPALEQAVAGTSYYGRDFEAQRNRVGRPGAIRDAVENGQILLGSPETVMKQIKRIRDDIGAGILDLIFMHPEDDKARRAIEIFGAKMLPRLHEME
ncbi:MAG TPA: LLM class flavin-dependent oxidoreductase [Stellaceae bacterium]|jgi:alkanesulfonate monooxygenase SsuD/methylene tetrahydromethanopterin reductase-like flavin-dependent oxidoreductase (luciferase family)